jgi:pyridoxal phosphate enzyme (YggS family)
MNNYTKNFDDVLQKIEAARIEADEHRIIKIVAASKYVGSDEINTMYEIGQRCFGENRIQDLKSKSLELIELPIEWHYIGKIQTNKINALLDLDPFLIHSVESLEMAKEIDKRAKVKEVSVDVLLQINSANEESKGGCTLKEAKDIYKEIQSRCENINLKGVMSIGAHSDDEKLIEKSFRDTYEVFDSLKEDGAKYCSMGMSGDFELAIKCGSNMLRLGSILFK